MVQWELSHNVLAIMNGLGHNNFLHRVKKRIPCNLECSRLQTGRPGGYSIKVCSWFKFGLTGTLCKISHEAASPHGFIQTACPSMSGNHLLSSMILFLILLVLCIVT